MTGYRPLAGGTPTARPLPGLVPDQLRPSPAAADALLAAGITLFMLATAVGTSHHGSGRRLLAHLSLALLGGVALGWRRRAPRAVLGTEVLLILAEGAAGLTQDAGIGLVVAVYTLATVSSWRTTLIAAVPAVTGTIAGRLAHPNALPLAVTASVMLTVAGAGVLGLYIGTRRAYVEELSDRAARLEREQQLLAERVVAEERTRIARELHDITAHHVSLMVVQSAAARETLGHTHPVASSLEAICATGRQALSEMRRMLELLRPDSEIEHAPQPGLADLAALKSQFEHSGMRVDLDVQAGSHPLPPGVDLSAYRIVQEALTNSLRHARASRSTVTITRTNAAVDLEIVDDGIGAPETVGSGHGIVGMRERVALYGGEFHAGPTPGAGFRVHAHIPLPATP